MASIAASVCSRLTAQLTVATPALSLSSLPPAGGVFFKSCKASLHLPRAASERLWFMAAVGSTAGALCGTCATTGVTVIRIDRANELAYGMRFIKIEMGQVGWPPAPLYVLCA